MIAIDLSGKIALVTGASQGIGEAIARALHQAGATLALNHPDLGDGKTRTDAEAIAHSMNRHRADSALVVAADVSSEEAVRALMAEVKARLGGLDVLVNNAGVLRDRSIAKMSLDEWRAVLDTNLTGVFLGCKYGLEILRDGGSIVNLGSLSASAGFHGQANYASAKAGVHALTRVAAREAARRNIRVNAVAPRRDRHADDGRRGGGGPRGDGPVDPAWSIRRRRRGRVGRAVPRLAPGVLRHGSRPGSQRRMARIA